MTNASNQYAVSTVSRSNVVTTDGILYGRKWGDASITYSFPTSTTDFVADYYGIGPAGFSAALPQLQQAAISILDKNDGNKYNNGFAVEGFTNLNISLGSTSTATLRFSMSSVLGMAQGDPTARGYFISDQKYSKAIAGDAWFSNVGINGTHNSQQTPGQGGYATLLHEIGHILGLKHTHDDGGTGWPLMPSAYDGHSYTVMSYKPLPNYSQTTSLESVQSFMPVDIAALQYLYGANFSTNNGNTTYSWLPGIGVTYVNNRAALTGSEDFIWQTIWDGGGVDTYNLSAFTTDSVVDLRAGSYSTFTSLALQFYDAATSTFAFAPGNIANPYRYNNDDRSLIENIITGSGDDRLIGNQVNNVFTGGSGADVFVLRNAWGVDTITDFEDGVDLIQIERKNNEPTAAQLLSGAVQQGSKVVITYLDMKIKLDDFTLVELTANDFIII